MSDDSGNNVGNAYYQNAAPSGLPWYADPAQGGGQITPYMAAIGKAVASGALDPTKPLGPAGAKSPIGTDLTWAPYDPNQELHDAHSHFGDTYDDPNLGKLQSIWTEPSMSGRRFDALGPKLAGVALAAITGGAASPLLGALLSSAMQYGGTGKINPLQTALSALPGVLGATGALGGIDPSILQAYRVGSTAYGLGNTAYQASRGNYNPAINTAAGFGLNQLTGSMG